MPDIMNAKSSRKSYYYPVIEPILALVVGFILTYLLGQYFIATIPRLHLDGSFLLELSSTLVDRGGAYSWLLQAAVDGSKTWGADVETVCKLPLVATAAPYNAFDNHAYYMIYPIAVMSHFWGGENVISYLNAAAFILLLLCPYLYLRRQGINFLSCILFSVVISLHPAWLFASIGDFYMDRLYMPIALIYILMLDEILGSKYGNKYFLLLCLALGVMASLMTERAAIMVSLSTLALIYIHNGFNRFERIHTILATFSICLIIYVAWYFLFRFVGESAGGNLIQSGGLLVEFFSRFLLDEQIHLVKIFFLVNTFSLILFSFFGGLRIILFAIMAISPNILISVGGAELTGWSTHYHSMYFPILIYCGIKGIVAFSRKKNYMPVITMPLLLIACCSFLLLFDNYKGSFHKDIKVKILASSLGKSWVLFTDNESSNDRLLLETRKKLRLAFDERSIISSIDKAMPSLYQGHFLRLYPIGIDTSQYAILRFGHNNNMDEIYRGAATHHGAEKEDILDTCLTRRLEKIGYDLEHPLIINNFAILERKGKDVENKEATFSDELLLNSGFTGAISEWIPTPGVEKLSNNQLLLSKGGQISRGVRVRGYSTYRYSVTAECVNKTIFNMQVSWLNSDGELLDVEIVPRVCGQKKMLSFDTLSPGDAVTGIVFITSLAGEEIVVDHLSFRQKIDDSINFSEELLPSDVNGDGFASWNLTAGIKKVEKNGLLINKNGQAAIPIVVSEQKFYRYSLVSTCAVESEFYMQVNWLRANGESLSAVRFPKKCGGRKKSFIDVASPNAAAIAAVYIISPGALEIVVDSPSFKQELND